MQAVPLHGHTVASSHTNKPQKTPDSIVLHITVGCEQHSLDCVPPSSQHTVNRQCLHNKACAVFNTAAAAGCRTWRS